MRRHFAALPALLGPLVAVIMGVSTVSLSPSARGENLSTIESQLTAMQTVLNELDTHYGMLEFKDDTFNVGLEFLRKKIWPPHSRCPNC